MGHPLDSRDKTNRKREEAVGGWRALVCFRVRSSVGSFREAKLVDELCAAKRVDEKRKAKKLHCMKEYENNSG